MEFGHFFCTHCGARLKNGYNKCQSCSWPIDEDGDAVPTAVNGGVGWFEDVKNRRFAKYDNQHVMASILFLFILLAGIIGYLFYSGNFEMNATGFSYAAVLAALFCLPETIFLLSKNRRKREWEGKIVDKLSVEKTRRIKSDDGHSYTESYSIYQLVVERANGKARKYSLGRDAALFDYYRVNDYIRYHGKAHLKGLEKYDKRFDSFTYCLKCGNRNNFSRDYCSACGCPVIKAE